MRLSNWSEAKRWLALLGAACAAVLMCSSEASAKPAPKVEICHIPPGNPANAHTIRVSGNAIEAHLKHGDYIGSCELLCEEECDDGNPCTIDECVAGECVHSAVTCNDLNQCTADSCNPDTGGCEYDALSGDSCTGEASACTFSTGTCNDAGSCVLEPKPECCETDEECADDNLCTSEVCTNNKCVLNPDGDVECLPRDACEDSYCEEATGECIYPDISENCPPPDTCEEGGFCDPATGCVYVDIPGCCVSDDDPICDDNDPCTDNLCINNACANPVCHDPVNFCDDYETCDENCLPMITGERDCSDLDLCTDDVCDPSLEACRNPAKCVDGSPCTDDICDDATGDCSHPDICVDDDWCTVGEYCDPDPEVGCVRPERDCSDGDPCTIDSCSSELAECVHEPKCDESAGEFCNPTTGACETETTCEFSAIDTNSTALLHFADGYDPIGAVYELAFTGTTRIICDTEVPDGTTQRACRAEFENIDPMYIPGIGDICLIPVPAEQCETGLIDCSPGFDQDIELALNHRLPVGDCTDNQACKTACADYCEDLGATRASNSEACEGFCRLNDTPMCTPDEVLPRGDGHCEIGDTCDELQHADACACECLWVGNDTPVGPGHARMEIGYGININFSYTDPVTGELVHPGRGEDKEECTDDDVPEATLPPTCFPFTTTTAIASIQNANDVANAPITTGEKTGSPFTCTDGVVLTPVGARLEGVGNDIDGRLFDFSTALSIGCE